MKKWQKGDSFELTNAHLSLLAHAYVEWQGYEPGAPAIDPECPYGSDSVAYSIIEILHWPCPREDDESLEARQAWDLLTEKADNLHAEMQTALQIVLGCMTFQPGVYRYVADDYERARWKRYS